MGADLAYAERMLDSDRARIAHGIVALCREPQTPKRDARIAAAIKRYDRIGEDFTRGMQGLPSLPRPMDELSDADLFDETPGPTR